MMPSEYAENDYIRALPPILTPRGHRQAIEQAPLFDPMERTWPHELRYHCVLRLKRYFHADSRQVEFARGFDAMLRQGYLGRDSTNRAHEGRQQAIATSLAAGELLDRSKQPVVIRNADSSFLIGMPGMGKSLTVQRVLSQYTQVIRHDTGEVQIVWIKLECPPRGSIRAMCADFFEQVDDLLGQDTYRKLYASSNASDESMMGHMVLVANRHSIGCLVVDEIQHLGKAGAEEHLLMTFLTTLINKIGVPLLCIGTMSGFHLIQKTGRMVRRSLGLASATWSRLEEDGEDDEWRRFVTKLWRYQWTAEPTPLDDALLAELYKHTQGVVDLVVKLFMAVQIRMIDLNLTSGGEEAELITPNDIAEAAKKHFGAAQGMLDALRSRNPKRIAEFDDLTPFHEAYWQSMSGTRGAILDDAGGDDDQTSDAPHVAFMGEASGVVKESLRRQDFERGEVEEAMRHVAGIIGRPNFANLSAFLQKAEEILRAPRPARTGADAGEKVDPASTYVEGDLRQIAEQASAAGESTAAAFTAASKRAAV